MLLLKGVNNPGILGFLLCNYNLNRFLNPVQLFCEQFLKEILDEVGTFISFLWS